MATALDVYMPFSAGDGANVTEAMWAQMAEFWRMTGVISQASNEFEVYGDSSGMQVKVKTGKCWIKGHYGSLTSEETLAIAAADPTNGRIDRVVLQLDWTNNVINLDVLTGTAAASPSAPTLTQSSSKWEISLAQVAVAAAASTIAAGNVTDERLFSYDPSRRGVEVPIFSVGVDHETGDGKGAFEVPPDFDRMNLVEVYGVITGDTGTTGTLTVQLRRKRSGTDNDMLSTRSTIDSGERSTRTAASAAVINTSYDDVRAGDVIYFDVDAKHTTAGDGLIYTLIFERPDNPW